MTTIATRTTAKLSLTMGMLPKKYPSSVTPITQPIPLPDSLAARADAADSLETITYGLRATFRQDGTLEGTYRIGAPDLIALARGSGGYRCEYVYEVRGAPRLRPRQAEPAVPAPVERR